MVDRIRPEMTFNGVEELKDQIRKDIEKSKQVLSTSGDSPA